MSGHAFRHPDYQVRYCDTCGLYFKSDSLSEEALAEFYRVLPFEAFESAELFPTDRRVLRVVAPVQPGVKVLDFGCGVGRILEHLTARHQCYGVEVNARSCEVAKLKGIQILHESALQNGAEYNFDFVILADVFEHLLNPFQVLHILTEALAANGALIISTGNADAIRCQEYLSQFWYFRTLGHLQMLTQKHLQWCAEKLNLKLTDLHVTSHYVTPLYQQCHQYVRSWSFRRFHRHPQSWMNRLLRTVPGIQRAEHWPVAPPITCTSDHLVAVLRKM